MKVLKKFWMFLIAGMPFGAWGLAPIAIGAIAAGVGIVGVSIWRSVSPVNMQEAFEFFSSCWTCQVFSDVMMSMSNLLPGVYHSLGLVVIPMSVTLLAVLIAWRLSSNMINRKMEDGFKLIGNFSTYIVKLSVLIGLLLMPLPRFITSIFIEPALTIGTSLDYVVSDNNSFSECMVASAIVDPVAISDAASQYGAFSPKLRHQLACEVANIHQITGLGMTVGWTLMNMAFDYKYEHKILSKIPIFPNIPMMFGGFLVLALYFFALLPIPLYFLEVFIKLSLDLIMLPLMLMAWMFDEDEFAIFPKGGKTIRQMIDDVIKAVVGIALTVVFLTFSVMFLNAAFGVWPGAQSLQEAIMNPNSQVSARTILDGLFFQNDSLITVILMGVFIAMFMTMIPQLTSMLFKIQISDKYYKTAKNDLNILWKGLNKIIPISKKAKASSSGNKGVSENSSNSNTSGYAPTDTNRPKYTRIEYIESTGAQYINTEVSPGNDMDVLVKLHVTSHQNVGAGVFVFGATDGTQTNSFGVKIFQNGSPSSVYAEYGSSNNAVDIGQPINGAVIELSMVRGGVLINHAQVMRLPDQSFNTSCNLFLFGCNFQGVIGSESAYRLYSCSIHRNGIILRNFIPVLDTQGVPCLYDTVGKNFYYNEGSQRFIAGPQI